MLKPEPVLLQESGDADSGEILEEIRHAEAIASIRNNAPKKPDSNPQPHSPLKLRLNPDSDKLRLNPDMEKESSVYENSEPSSPSQMPRQNGQVKDHVCYSSMTYNL